jgi:hypothetical protein
VNNTANLPASVEQSYRQKCKEIKKRIVEIESSNDVLTSQIQRARRAIQRMRLERAFLLQQLEMRTDIRVEDSEGSPSPPPTVGLFVCVQSIYLQCCTCPNASYRHTFTLKITWF